jgi:hypothetical protein
MSGRAIAREWHMSRRIVQRYLSSDDFPKRTSGTGLRPKGKGKLGRYRVYLRERWDAGEHSGTRLLRRATFPLQNTGNHAETTGQDEQRRTDALFA